jgi:hypothetical protein
MEVKLSEEKYEKFLGYVNSIKSLRRIGELKKHAGQNVFIALEGQISFYKPPFSDYGYINYTPYLTFSENNKKNNKLMSRFERRLQN